MKTDKTKQTKPKTKKKTQEKSLKNKKQSKISKNEFIIVYIIH